MDKPRPEKVALVEEARGRLSSADAALLTEYRGLKVDEMATLRRALRPAGGEYKVYKNTLVRFAARDLGLDGLEALLEGPVAIAFVQGDAAVAARALRDFARTHPHLLVKGGLLGENLISAEQAGALAELPSREVLLSQLAGMLAAPLRQLGGGMQALAQNLAFGLRALIDQRSADDGGASPVPDAAAEPPAAPEAPATEEAPAAAEAPEAETPAAGEGAGAPTASDETPEDAPPAEGSPDASD
ncbi:MAG: 50S ribosomal protein L10 [Acidimicrobiales bacterium]|nr:50S ribosomal protein L10 [Acidimicrobiales bacterium]